MTQNNLKDRQSNENYDPMDDWIPTMDAPDDLSWDQEQMDWFDSDTPENES